MSGRVCMCVRVALSTCFLSVCVCVRLVSELKERKGIKRERERQRERERERDEERGREKER